VSELAYLPTNLACEMVVMAITKFTCPDCGTRLKSSTDQPGDVVDCPKCGASIEIPPTLEYAAAKESEAAEPTTPSDKTPFRIKAPWEYAKEWARVRFGLLLCSIAAILTVAELVTGEITDRLFRRAYTPTELYFGLVIGLLIGGFRVYSKIECRHVPRQWVSRPFLWVCVGFEAALLVVVTGTALTLAATPPGPSVEEADLPPELKQVLSPTEQAEYKKQATLIRDLQSGTPVTRDPRVRVISFGFGLATLLAGILSILWPMYLKELAATIKHQDAWDLGDRALDILGPAFLLWVLSVSIFQFMASITEVSGVYRPQGKSVTVLGLLTIQILLIRLYWRLRVALRAKSRLRKPKDKPAIGHKKG
jgi:predicted RNA-binding Zn-ribbon protein involved in translation (DUF1610 family)